MKLVTVLSVLVAVVVPLGACSVGAEGERCNPAVHDDQCAAGLACTQPVDCPETYCCPTRGAIHSAYCQPGCSGGQASACAAGADADCGDAASGVEAGSE